MKLHTRRNQKEEKIEITNISEMWTIKNEANFTSLFYFSSAKRAELQQSEL